jgi:outer membrane PBP1 activator LpoA protein
MGVNGGSGISDGQPGGLPLYLQQPGVTIGGLTIPAAPTDADHGGSGRVDAVYILATPEEIAFIKPMIAMRNGSQSGATLYASSRSAQGTAGPDFRLEMDGLAVQRNTDAWRANAFLMQQALERGS